MVSFKRGVFYFYLFYHKRRCSMRREGFTLIELLIVVIIIGILASIAVPQFFRVAERARAAEGVQALGAVRRAQLRYYSEHGITTAAAGDLDYDVPTLRYFSAPAPVAATYTGGNENLATITRNGISNPGFGAYTLTVHGDGSITCAGGTKCPAGF